MKKPSTPSDPAAKSRLRDAARIVARSVWTANFKAAHPDATDEARSAAWKDTRKEQIRLALRALRKLERGGVLKILDAPAPDKEAA